MIQKKGEFFNSPFFLLSLKSITDTYRNHNNKHKTAIMKQEEEKPIGVPENAFRELKPGEVYNPLMSPDKKYPEVNLWSVLWGIAMAVPLFGSGSLSGIESGTGIRSSHSHCHYRRRRIRRSQA